MILRIFSMYDTKAEAYIRPFFMPNVALAQRAIVTAGQDPEHPFAQHPSDYILYELGTWEEEHAQFDLTVAPLKHGSVKQMTPKVDQAIPKLMETKPSEVKHG